MPRLARGEVLDQSEVQVVHCMQRCARRAFLYRDGPLTGNSYEHRRGWIRDRLEFLASVFLLGIVRLGPCSGSGLPVGLGILGHPDNLGPNVQIVGLERIRTLGPLDGIQNDPDRV